MIDELTNLQIETSESHHEALSATEGEDPDWPIWYAIISLIKCGKAFFYLCIYDSNAAELQKIKKALVTR